MSTDKTFSSLDTISKVVFFGLIVFYCGIYIFPDNGGYLSRIFYILILLPMLYVVFSLNKEFFINHNIWVLMVLPVYLTLSHFWANDENIMKSNFFHIKKNIYILFFIFSVFYVSIKWPNFLRVLFQSLCVIGFISAIISIFCVYSSQCGTEGKRLASFSVQDINKAGVIYTLHMGLCFFLLLHGFFEKIKTGVLLRLFLLMAFLTSGFAVVLTKTEATWVMLLLLLGFSLLPRWSTRIFVILAMGLLALGILFYLLDGYDYLMKDNSFSARINLAKAALSPWKETMFFGLGLTHKLPIMELPHPHNIFVDVLRFGGILGLLILLFTLGYLLIQGMIAANKDILVKFCLGWFVSGIAIMSVYAQQPITRPGGYIWFLYWMPIVILAAEISRLNFANDDE